MGQRGRLRVYFSLGILGSDLRSVIFYRKNESTGGFSYLFLWASRVVVWFSVGNSKKTYCWRYWKFLAHWTNRQGRLLYLLLTILSKKNKVLSNINQLLVKRGEFKRRYVAGGKITNSYVCISGQEDPQFDIRQVWSIGSSEWIEYGDGSRARPVTNREVQPPFTNYKIDEEGNFQRGR